MIAALKGLHIAALVIWCAGLIALPLLLAFHKQLTTAPDTEARYRQFRIATHVLYTAIATPAAIIAISAGTALIFAAQVYEPWLLLKLAFVSVMVFAHAFCGHMVLLSGERPIDWRMPPVILTLLVTIPVMTGILWLVLVKPDLSELANDLPEWMTEPRDIALPALLQESLP